MWLPGVGTNLDWQDKNAMEKHANQLLRWYFRQYVLADMPGIGEPVFEHGFPPSTDQIADIHENVLDVNLNVQPRQLAGPRKANFSEQSTQSNKSIDSDSPGFVFYQTGAVEYWADDPKELRTSDNANNGPWLSTDFQAV